MAGTSPWLVEIAAAGPDAFYAVPHAGAGVAAVRDLCRQVGLVAASAAVRLPAREARLDEAPLRDVHQIARLAAEAIARHAQDRPITLYGHCSGAIIAFEIARRLPPPSLRTLFLSAHPAPDRIPVGGAWRWPAPDFVRRVADDGYLPDFIVDDEELIELLLPALRADYEAIETYRPEGGARIDADIIGLLGDDDASVNRDDFAGWSRFTTAGFRTELLPGGHNLLLDHAASVAELIISAPGGSDLRAFSLEGADV
jgi:medium-chain acyl-[acyl-carrier-protein] hydrolase